MSNIPTEDTIVKMDSVEEEEWIRAIKALLFRNSEEGLIPEVTVSDNGKVLTVVKGVWDKADVPSGGGGEAGYECTETREQLFEETVTTVAQGNCSVSNLGYSQQITAETLIVTFDGVEYNCPKQDVGGGYFVYGASTVSDFSQFPFSLGSSASENIIYTQTAGEYSVKAVSYMATVTTTPCFEKAVNAAYDGVEIVDIVQTGIDASQSMPIINFSYDDVGQILQKYNNGKAVVRLQLFNNSSLKYYMDNARLYVDAFYATSSSMTGDRYVLHAHSTSVYNVSAHAIRIYDITLEVGRSSNSLAIEAIQIVPDK